MSRLAGLAARGLAAGSLAAGCLLAGPGLPAAALGAVAALALILAVLPVRRPWRAPLTLVGFAALAVAGLLLGLGAGWMLLAVVAALCAWDLEHVNDTASEPAYAGSEAGRGAVERAHLGRLLAVAAGGLVLGAAGLLAPARLTFLPALLLSLLALLGLSWVISFFRAWGD